MECAENTVVILSAEFGAMPLAFQEAGFHVVAAYGSDENAGNVYAYNFGKSLDLRDWTQLDMQEIPDADVIALRLRPVFQFAGKNVKSEYEAFKEILYGKHPKVFFLELNGRGLKALNLAGFYNDMNKMGYTIFERCCSTYELTGLPVEENKTYVVGITKQMGEKFELLGKSSSVKYTVADICEDLGHMGSKYCKTNQDIGVTGGEDTFICWKANKYIETERILWNHRAMPLVRINGEIRKITLSEIALLKGYPVDFDFAKARNKSKLYRELIYGSNVIVLNRFAESISAVLDSSYYMPPQADRIIRFEAILKRYFNDKNYKLEYRDKGSGQEDFLVRYEERSIHIGLKYYYSNFGVEGKVKRACQAIYDRRGENGGEYLLFVGNIAEEEVKDFCREHYKIDVLDVKNLLCIFDEFPDIKNEFIALLDYTVEDIVPQQPDHDIFKESIERKTEISLRDRLAAIKPGKEQYAEYEEVCIEILKYVLGDYLTLWKKQVRANEDLYRFDLCCKIKHGLLPEFFDTVIRFFDTKYIVFEFKNYKDPISQEEIYTTEKYLYEKALRRVAIIISRKGADKGAVRAAGGSLRESGKLIICLSDQDLLHMIDLKDREEASTAGYLMDMFDDMLIKLEK